METQEHRRGGISVLEIVDDDFIISSPQDLLDIVSDYSIKRIILKKNNIVDDFFDLRTGFAGEIMQKASSYKLYIGFVGDFSNCESKSFRDFMYESNEAGKIVFKATPQEVLKLFLRK
jgi:hypothetical protein